MIDSSYSLRFASLVALHGSPISSLTEATCFSIVATTSDMARAIAALLPSTTLLFAAMALWVSSLDCLY